MMVVRGPDLLVEVANPFCQRLFGGPISGLPFWQHPLGTADTLLEEQSIRRAMGAGTSLEVRDVVIAVAIDGKMEKRHWSFRLYPWNEPADPRDRVLAVGVATTRSVVEQRWRETSAETRMATVINADQAMLEAVLQQDAAGGDGPPGALGRASL